MAFVDAHVCCRKMAELYNDEYYGEEETEHPFANEADEAFLNEIGYEDEEWGEGEEEWEEGDEATEQAPNKGKKLSKKEQRNADRDAARAAKKKEKNISEAELEGVAKATGMDKYLEEYYQLDFEGMAGDIPCRFKYKQTVPQDVGLTPLEILSLGLSSVPSASSRLPANLAPPCIPKVAGGLDALARSPRQGKELL